MITFESWVYDNIEQYADYISGSKREIDNKYNVSEERAIQKAQIIINAIKNKLQGVFGGRTNDVYEELKAIDPNMRMTFVHDPSTPKIDWCVGFTKNDDEFVVKWLELDSELKKRQANKRRRKMEKDGKYNISDSKYVSLKDYITEHLSKHIV